MQACFSASISSKTFSYRRGWIRPCSHLNGALESNVDGVPEVPLDGAQRTLQLPAGGGVGGGSSNGTRVMIIPKES